MVYKSISPSWRGFSVLSVIQITERTKGDAHVHADETPCKLFKFIGVFDNAVAIFFKAREKVGQPKSSTPWLRVSTLPDD